MSSWYHTSDPAQGDRRGQFATDPNKLRDIFNQHQDSALQYASALRARRQDANNPLIRNGSLDKHDPQFLAMPVAALVKTAVGIVQMIVRELGAEQTANFNAPWTTSTTPTTLCKR